MSVLNEVLQASVEKYINTKYQALVISEVSPVLDRLLTPENVEKAVQKFGEFFGAVENLAEAWNSLSGLKTEAEVAADAQATLEESANMVNKNAENNRAIGSAITNIATGAALIALGVAKAAI